MFRRWAWTEGLLSAAVIVTGAVAATALVPETVYAQGRADDTGG